MLIICLFGINPLAPLCHTSSPYLTLHFSADHNLVGIASKTLKKHGQSSQASAMQKRVLSSGSYDEALCIIGEYVNIVSVDDTDDE